LKLTKSATPVVIIFEYFQQVRLGMIVSFKHVAAVSREA